MGTIDSVTKRLQSDRRDVPITASISAADSDTLDDLVDFLEGNGAKATRSTVVRALVLDGLDEFSKRRAEAK